MKKQFMGQTTQDSWDDMVRPFLDHDAMYALPLFGDVPVSSPTAACGPRLP